MDQRHNPQQSSLKKNHIFKIIILGDCAQVPLFHKTLTLLQCWQDFNHLKVNFYHNLLLTFLCHRFIESYQIDLVIFARAFHKCISQLSELISTVRNQRLWREMNLSQSLCKFGILLDRKDIKVQELHSIEEQKLVFQFMILQMQELSRIWLFGSKISLLRLTPRIQTTSHSLFLEIKQIRSVKER